MEFFKNLRNWFSRKKNQDEKLAQKGVAQVVLEMPQCVVFPQDLLEPLCSAIALKTCSAVIASSNQILLYNMYDYRDNAFLGSLYALEHNHLVFGNIVGSQQVLSFKPGAFRLEKTKELTVPLEDDGADILVLMCKYDYPNISALCIKKMDKLMQPLEMVHVFDKGISVDKAIAYFRENIKAN